MPAAAGQPARSARKTGGVARSTRRRPGHSAGSAAAGKSILDMGEVWGAIQSLYMDMLKPFGRILRKRLAERAMAAGRGAQDIDMDYLRSMCTACPYIRVEDTEGGDWAALFTCYPETFVDIYSPEDLYPAELWQRAAVYFEGLDDDSMVLPGGRYSCAQELMSRRLDFLWGYSLGQVSHMVQLAISQKKLLGYLSGAVVPYGRSGSKAKDECAAMQQRFAPAPHPTGGSSLVQWEQLRRCMKELMTRVPVDGTMPLSNIKRLFRSRFEMELSETALGHSKLSELLNDPQLQDICFVKLQGHGYVVTHPPQHGFPISISSSVLQEARTPPIHEEGSLCVTFADPEMPSPRPAPEDPEPEPRRYKIRNTFIHVDEDLSAQTPSNKLRAAPPRSKTAPVAFGSDVDSGDEDEDEAAVPADGGSDCAADSCSTGTGDEAGLHHGQVVGGDEAVPSWGGLAGLAGRKLAAETSLEPMYLLAAPPAELDGPGLESAAAPVLPTEVLEMPPSPQDAPRRPGLTTPPPFMVQNTFIHIAAEPETPWVSVARRAKTTTHARSTEEDDFGFGV